MHGIFTKTRDKTAPITKSTLSVIKVNFCNYIKKKISIHPATDKNIKEREKNKERYNKENKDNISELPVPGQKKIAPEIQGLFYLCLSNIVFPVSIKWYFNFNDVRTNIKIKKKRKINCC